MNKTVVSIIVLVIVVGGLFFMLKGKNSEAPTVDTGSVDGMSDMGDNTVPVGSPTPENPAASSGLLDMNVGVTVGGVKEFTVTGKNFSFSPNVITVKKGDKVKITFKNEAGFHDLKIDEYNVATKQGQAPFTEVVEFTADKVGSFQYYCSVGTHRQMGMWGTLKVE